MWGSIDTVNSVSDQTLPPVPAMANPNTISQPGAFSSKTKKCCSCGATKRLVEFYRRSKNDSRPSGPCKLCKNLKSREWAKSNPDKLREYERAWRKANANKAWVATLKWRSNNKESYLENKRRWQCDDRKSHPEKYKAAGRSHYQRHRIRVINRTSNYRRAHREQYLAYSRHYGQKYRSLNPEKQRIYNQRNYQRRLAFTNYMRTLAIASAVSKTS